MSAVFTNLVLASGQIPLAQGPIYTATGSVLVKGIQLGNNQPITVTMLFYRSHSAGTRMWRRVQLRAYETAELIEGASSIKLETGDAIIAQANYDSLVDYTIDGVTVA